MRKKHLFTSFALITALSVQMLAPTMGQPAMAATKKKANKESVSLNVGKKVTLQWVVYNKAVSWKNSNKKVVSVKKTGKNRVVVTGKKVGTAKVTAKVKGKTFTWTIKVRKKKSTEPAPTVQPSTVFQGWTPTTSNTTGSTSGSTSGANTSATLNPNPTVIPGGGFDPSVSTTTPGAVTSERKFNYRPIDTSRPAKLDAKFYLSDFEQGAENRQFVFVNVCNNMTEDILIEPEAYIQTDGVCYPALNSLCYDEGMGYIEVIKGKEKNSENEESETEAQETEEPKKETGDEGIEEEDSKEEAKEEKNQLEEENRQYENDYRVTYDAYDWVSGYYESHDNAGYMWLPSNKDSIFIFYIRVANKRYMTVVNYDKEDAKFYEADSSDLLFEIEGGDNKTEATSTPKVTGTPKPTSAPEETSDPEETDEPEKTTAPERTKKPGTTPETDEPEETGESEKTTAPERTKRPGTIPETDAPEETGEPDVTPEPEDPWDWDETPEPGETDGPSAIPEPEETEKPHATQPPRGSSENGNLENVQIKITPITDTIAFSIPMTIYNNTEDDLIIKSGAYVSTDGVDYDAMLSSDTKEDVFTIEAGHIAPISYESADYLLNGWDCEIWDFPINEDSTFTLYFSIGGKEYQAVINLADGTYTIS